MILRVKSMSRTEPGIWLGFRRQRLMKKRMEEDSSWMFPWPVTQPPSSNMSTEGLSCSHRSRDMYRSIESNSDAVANLWSRCPSIREEKNKLQCLPVDTVALWQGRDSCMPGPD